MRSLGTGLECKITKNDMPQYYTNKLSKNSRANRYKSRL